MTACRKPCASWRTATSRFSSETRGIRHCISSPSTGFGRRGLACATAPWRSSRVTSASGSGSAATRMTTACSGDDRQPHRKAAGQEARPGQEETPPPQKPAPDAKARPIGGDDAPEGRMKGTERSEAPAPHNEPGEPRRHRIGRGSYEGEDRSGSQSRSRRSGESSAGPNADEKTPQAPAWRDRPVWANAFVEGQITLCFTSATNHQTMLHTKVAKYALHPLFIIVRRKLASAGS